MRAYRLFRHEDESGVSGVGLVAEAVEFSSGKVAVSFLPGRAGVASVTVFESLDDAIRIHGHGGKTSFVPVTATEYAQNERSLRVAA